MPRTSRCPTCDTNVKVPDGAPRGALVRCPHCEETFQPPFLKPVKVVEEDDEAYDPQTAERYAAGRRTETREDTDREERRRKIRREVKEQREQNRRLKSRRGWFEGIDGFILLTSGLLALVVPVVYFGMTRLAEVSPEKAGTVLVFVCLVLAAIGYNAGRIVRQRRSGV